MRLLSQEEHGISRLSSSSSLHSHLCYQCQTVYLIRKPVNTIQKKEIRWKKRFHLLIINESKKMVEMVEKKGSKGEASYTRQEIQCTVWCEVWWKATHVIAILVHNWLDSQQVSKRSPIFSPVGDGDFKRFRFSKSFSQTGYTLFFCSVSWLTTPL